MDFFAEQVEQVVFQEILNRVENNESQEHFERALEACFIIQKGISSLHQSNPGKSISILERMLGQIEPIHGVEILRARINLMLVGEYLADGRHDTAIASGHAALPILKSESRQVYYYAACLHDIGAVLTQSGHVREGITFIEQAVSIYDRLPDCSQGETSRRNLERLYAALAQRNKKPSIWSRLFHSE